MWISHKSDSKIFSGIDVFFLTPLHWSSPRNKMLPNIQQTAVQEHKPTLNHSSTGKINSIVPLQRIRLCMKHLGKHRENKFQLSFWSQEKNQLSKTQQHNYTVQVLSKLYFQENENRLSEVEAFWFLSKAFCLTRKQ